MKLLSVLVAAYRADRWLPECLASIAKQKLPADCNIEVLIGVDGCDATRVQALACKTDYTRVITMRANNGTYITFNTLMEHAKGDYISRFDADDVMRPGYLLAQLERLKAGADMTMTWSTYTDVHLKPTDYVISHKNYHPKGGLRRGGSEGQFMIKRTVWEALGGFYPWPCAADTDFRDRAKIAGFNVDIVERFLYYRRTHHDSLTAHPTTNFESPIRKKLERKREQLVLAYEAAKIPIKISPVTAAIDSIYE